MVITSSIAVSGGAVPVYVASPATTGQSKASLLIVPSIFGVTDGLVEQMGEIARAGYLTVAMDPFWRIQPGVIAFSEFQAAFDRVRKLDAALGYADFKAACDWVRQNKKFGGHLAGLGICFGAPYCLLGATDGLLDGVITWHGSRIEQYIERSAEMKVPMQHQIGGADKFVPEAAITKIKAAFEGRRDVEIHIHDGCDHGFCQRGNPAAYQEGPEKKALAGALQFLAGFK